jgi:hypothetical protein
MLAGYCVPQVLQIKFAIASPYRWASAAHVLPLAERYSSLLAHLTQPAHCAFGSAVCSMSMADQRSARTMLPQAKTRFGDTE